MKSATIVLGVTGGIAAYKSAELASKFTQAGFRVEVIMTDSAQRFITPLTFRNLTGRPVVTTLWDLASEFSVEHVALAEAADIVLIAPATANIIAHIAAGFADDMLTCTVLATKAPVVMAPAMNDNMWANPVTQENVEKLKKRGFVFIEPAMGRLASGKTGKGRLADLDAIYSTVTQVLGKKGDLAKKRIVVTAGGTQEPVDPVRCLTNRSSGKMGYAIAMAARDRGADVTLVTAPTSLPEPHGIKCINVKTTEDMLQAVLKATEKADALIMAAAPADFRPVKSANAKIKRQNLESLTLELEKTPDILAQIKGKIIRVGFAAESEKLLANASDKIKRKNLDLIVANDITAEGCAFGSDTNRVIIIDKQGKIDELPIMSKREVAEKILDRVKGLLGKK